MEACSRSYEVQCEELAMDVIQERISKEKLQRDSDLSEGIKDEYRQGMRVDDIKKLEHYHDAYMQNRFGDLM